MMEYEIGQKVEITGTRSDIARDNYGKVVTITEKKLSFGDTYYMTNINNDRGVWPSDVSPLNKEFQVGDILIVLDPYNPRIADVGDKVTVVSTDCNGYIYFTTGTSLSYSWATRRFELFQRAPQKDEIGETFSVGDKVMVRPDIRQIQLPNFYVSRNMVQKAGIETMIHNRRRTNNGFLYQLEGDYNDYRSIDLVRVS